MFGDLGIIQSLCHAHIGLIIIRDTAKMVLKNTANLCENRTNHGKITTKTRHQITGPQTIIQSIKLHTYIALTTIITMQCKVFICKILSSRSHIEPVGVGPGV